MLTVTARRVPLLDLRAQFAQVRQEAMTEITRVCESQELVLGQTVRQFEEAVAAYAQVGTRLDAPPDRTRLRWR